MGIEEEEEATRQSRILSIRLPTNMSNVKPIFEGLGIIIINSGNFQSITNCWSHRRASAAKMRPSSMSFRQPISLRVRVFYSMQESSAAVTFVGTVQFVNIWSSLLYSVVPRRACSCSAQTRGGMPWSNSIETSVTDLNVAPCGFFVLLVIARVVHSLLFLVRNLNRCWIIA